MMRLLDRYVLWQWIRIFVLTAFGFPLVSVLIQATDELSRLLDRGLTPGAIALSYLYVLPEDMAQMIPAACLFATVFTIGPLSRHSELTAAKAGGMSFHRVILPLVMVSVLASGLSFWVSEYATRASARALELQKVRMARDVSVRFNFVYRGDENWVYAIRQLDTEYSRMENLVMERQGSGPEFPTLAVVADSARWADSTGWTLYGGSSHLLRDSTSVATFQFRSLRIRTLTQAPRELLIEAKEPEEMAYRELGDYIAILARTGNDVRKLSVEQALKLAIPATCVIITLFGAPLAVTAPRAGAAVGVAISLGTMVSYILLINLTRAIGAGGLMDPVAAAWAPNLFFLLLGVVLLIRVRT